jgi:hypothetical protein
MKRLQRLDKARDEFVPAWIPSVSAQSPAVQLYETFRSQATKMVVILLNSPFTTEFGFRVRKAISGENANTLSVFSVRSVGSQTVRTSKQDEQLLLDFLELQSRYSLEKSSSKNTVEQPRASFAPTASAILPTGIELDAFAKEVRRNELLEASLQRSTERAEMLTSQVEKLHHRLAEVEASAAESRRREIALCFQEHYAKVHVERLQLLLEKEDFSRSQLQAQESSTRVTALMQLAAIFASL